jgi:threonine aldolase
MGEAVVVFNTKCDGQPEGQTGANRPFSEIVKYVRKQATQLYSKNRFIAAQFDAYLTDSLYLQLASQSNGMAQYLAEKLKDIPEVKISKKVESNAVFAILPTWLTEKLQEKYYFYTWNEHTGEVRWMCSFNTTKEDIDEFVDYMKKLLKCQTKKSEIILGSK